MVMTIPLIKEIRDDVGKYSFISKTEFKSGIFYMHYEKDGKGYVKKLPYRATKTQLETVISKIKIEIDWEVTRRKRYKNLISNEKQKNMYVGYETGEDNE